MNWEEVLTGGSQELVGADSSSAVAQEHWDDQAA